MVSFGFEVMLTVAMGIRKFPLFLLYVYVVCCWANGRFFLTIGFGDYYPTTEAGVSVFIVYALLAVPTMTIVGIALQLACLMRS